MVIAVASVALARRPRRPTGRRGPGSVGPTRCAAPEACAWLGARLDCGRADGVTIDADAIVGEFGALVAAASRADRRPPQHRRLPPPRRAVVTRACGRCRAGAAHDDGDGRRDAPYVAAGQRRRAATVARRVGGREPAVRAARAARPARAPRTGASRASAGRAPCSSTASWCARAWCWPRRPPAATIVTIEGLHRPSAGELDRRAAGVRRRRAPCSAGSARPAWSWPCTTCSTAMPDADELEMREAISGNLCRCTGYGRIFAAVQIAATRRRRGRR